MNESKARSRQLFRSRNANVDTVLVVAAVDAPGCTDGCRCDCECCGHCWNGTDRVSLSLPTLGMDNWGQVGRILRSSSFVLGGGLDIGGAGAVVVGQFAQIHRPWNR